MALSRAERAIEQAANPIPTIHILSHRLLLREFYPAKYIESASELRPRLDSACKRVDDARAFSAEFVVRLATGLLMKEFPNTSKRLAEFVGTSIAEFSANTLTSENLQGLDEYRERWENEMAQLPEISA